MASGVFGCVFGILGIFTIGIVFVPLAALCSIIGIANGAINLQFSTVFISSIGMVLAVVGWTMSPSLWIMTAAIIGAVAG